MIIIYTLHITYSVNALMNSRIPQGATRDHRRRIKFPRQHLLLAGAVAFSVISTMALLPSGDVEAKRNEVAMSIDAFQPSSVEPVINDSPASFAGDKAATTTIDATADVTDPATLAAKRAEAEAKALAQQAYEEEQRLGRWHTVTIRSGDNLSALFNAQKLSASVVYQITSTPEFGKALAHILPGQSLEFRINPQGVLTQFRYTKSKLESIFFSKTDDGYQAELVMLSPQVKTAFASSTIESSLFTASQKAGLSENLTMELAGIFGWDIDFVQDTGISLSSSLVQSTQSQDTGKESDTKEEEGHYVTRSRKRRSDEGEEDAPSKRKRSNSSGGVCLHVRGGKVSLELCSKCERKAMESGVL